MKRSSGILLHVTSLPSPYGIGTLGKEAFDFIDFLSLSGQHYWQILPAGPTGYADSPYQSFSAFAGNPYFIDLDLLIQQGWLQAKEVTSIDWGKDPSKVDYGKLYEQRKIIFRKAFNRTKKNHSFMESMAEFRGHNREWIYEYAFFMALKEHFNMKPWNEWDDRGIRIRQPESISYYCELLEEEIHYHIFLQYLFFSQFGQVRAYAEEKGIRLIGDLPIYLPLDSAEVWSNPEYFLLDENRKPLLVGGVPPDSFAESGQLWGSPIYDWNALKRNGYSLWIQRLEAASKLFDVVRLDHFRGFESYWAVSGGEKTAINGTWMPGPGLDFIKKMQEAFPDLGMIAENLGFLTEEVNQLVLDSGLPGMKILQFAFGKGGEIYLPHNYDHNQVVYIGTHDNSPVKAWLAKSDKEEVDLAKDYLGISRKEDMSWGLVRCGMSSVADLFIAQMQDYLDLPESARMNTPGTVLGNWKWRLVKGQLTKELAGKIAKITKRYGR